MSSTFEELYLLVIHQEPLIHLAVGDSGYAQRLTIIEDLSFFFRGIDMRNGTKQGINTMAGVVCSL